MEEIADMAQGDIDMFNGCRAALLSLGRRILGSESEAEDIVQETYLRWQRSERGDIKSPKAFLTTVYTRLCLNQLKLGRVRLAASEPGLVFDNLGSEAPAPDALAELADALTQAFTRMLVNLTPAETAVFLLREAFDFDYSEIAPIVERTAANCRQIHKRARARIVRDQPAPETSLQSGQNLARVFRNAVETGELESLLDLLSEDAVLLQDAGGLRRPPPPALQGEALRSRLRLVMKAMLSKGSRLLSSGVLSGKHVIMSPGRDGVGHAILFRGAEGRVAGVRIITCPAMLRKLRVLLAWQFSTEQLLHPRDRNN